MIVEDSKKYDIPFLLVTLLIQVKLFMEGEAQRYSEHAQTLLLTIFALRNNSELDLIRGESLLSLDHPTRLRLINKTYRLESFTQNNSM